MNNEITAFINTTLKAVIDAIDNANFESLKPGVELKVKGNKAFIPMAGRAKFDVPTEINFDIAVNAATSDSGSGGIDLKVVKVGGELKSENASSSRVSFSIPISQDNTI